MGPLCLLVPGVAFHRVHKGGWSVTVDRSRIPDGAQRREMDSPTGIQAALPLTCCVLRQGTLSPRLQLLKKEGGLEGWFPMALDHSWAMMLRTLYLKGMALLRFLVPSPPG